MWRDLTFETRRRDEEILGPTIIIPGNFDEIQNIPDSVQINFLCLNDHISTLFQYHVGQLGFHDHIHVEVFPSPQLRGLFERTVGIHGPSYDRLAGILPFQIGFSLLHQLEIEELLRFRPRICFDLLDGQILQRWIHTGDMGSAPHPLHSPCILPVGIHPRPTQIGETTPYIADVGIQEI